MPAASLSGQEGDTRCSPFHAQRISHCLLSRRVFRQAALLGPWQTRQAAHRRPHAIHREVRHFGRAGVCGPQILRKVQRTWLQWNQQLRPFFEASRCDNAVDYMRN